MTIAIGLAVAAGANFLGLLPLPGSALTPEPWNGAGTSTAGLLPFAGREPGKPWAALVQVENFSQAPVFLTKAELVDTLPGTDVLAITVDAQAQTKCPIASFEPDCVSSAMSSAPVGQQTVAPGQTTWFMVVSSGPGSLSGFRAVRVGYRSGPLSYTTIIPQGAFACVAVPAEQCPDDPWATSD